MRAYQQRLDYVANQLNCDDPLAMISDEELDGIIQLLKQVIEKKIEENGSQYTESSKDELREVPEDEFRTSITQLVAEWKKIQFKREPQ